VNQERCCDLGLADPIAPASGQDGSELAQLPLDVGRHLCGAFSLHRTEATTFHPTTLQALSTAADTRLGEGQDVDSREALQPTQSSKPQARTPTIQIPSAVHSLWVRLRAGAFMASIVRKESLSRFSSGLLDELSTCCQLTANPRLRLAELADELLYELQSQLPEQVQDPVILALLPY